MANGKGGGVMVVVRVVFCLGGRGVAAFGLFEINRYSDIKKHFLTVN